MLADFLEGLHGTDEGPRGRFQRAPHKDFKAYPDFWHETILAAYSAEEMPSLLDTRHRLLVGSYEYCAKLGNKFLSQWFEFNRDLQNILTAINGRQHEVDYARWLVGR